MHKFTHIHRSIHCGKSINVSTQKNTFFERRERQKNGDKARRREERERGEDNKRPGKEERDIVKVNKKERNTEKMGGREIGGENTETDGQTRRLKEVMERKGDRV